MSLGFRSSRFTGAVASASVMLPMALALACGGEPEHEPSGGVPADGRAVDSTPPNALMPVPSGDPSPNEGTEPTPLVPPVEAPVPVEEPPLRSPIWFSDDFESGTTASWDLTPGTGAAFAVALEPGTANHVLQYTAGSSTDNLIALITDAAWATTEANAGITPLADYYVQARVKPQTNGTTSNKQLFLVARYQDAANWYLGGLNVQTDLGATQVEAGARKAGTISRTVQGQREILQGAQGQADGQWYSVRFEVVGTALTVYFDGENIGSSVDADFAQGKIGLFTANKSFLLDDLVVGDASIKPVSLVLTPPTLLRTAEAETTPFQVDVRALTSDGTTADTFAAVSDNEAVASVVIAGSAVTVAPLSAGVAHVTFSSGSDPKLSKVLTLTVTPPYRDPPGTVAGLAAVTQPPAGQADVQADTPLALTFDGPPTLGAGSIRIFRASDDSVVDSVSVGAETDSLGPPSGTSGGRVRQVRTRPVVIDGNTVRIKPHSRVLQAGTEYYVGIADGAIQGTLGGTPFDGIGATAGWSFTTRGAAPAGANVTVDDDGADADFRTVQGALDHVMQNVAAATPATISVSNGTYRELLFERGKNNLTIRGESRDGVVIEYENFEGFNGGTGSSAVAPGTAAAGGRSLFLIESSDLLTLDNFTLRNTHRRTGANDQAETIYFNTDQGRLVATDMHFVSEQDTLQLKGYSWFSNSLIEGNVDFIWGNNRVALFEDSEIRTVGDSRGTAASGGYVLQARTVAAADKGFVFLNSRLTQGAGPAGTPVGAGLTYLARSGGNAGYFDNIAFINCRIDTHVAALGWAAAGVNGQPAPNPALATAASGWREFGSLNLAGNPLSLAARSGAARTLTAQEVAAGFANRTLIFAAFNNGAGWNPAP
ncbi:MAG TPA: pectinesterase family protein [Polyangiaceae bacterium]|nr:pectinesterase family protein [Polyangiaceae bacterium]